MEYWDISSKSEERRARSGYGEMTAIEQIEQHLTFERNNNNYLMTKNECLRNANQQFVTSYDSLKVQMNELLQERYALFQKNVSLIYEQTRLKKEVQTYRELLYKSSSKNKAILLTIKSAYDELIRSTSLIDEVLATHPTDNEHIQVDTEYHTESCLKIPDGEVSIGLVPFTVGGEKCSPLWYRLNVAEPALTPVQEEQSPVVETYSGKRSRLGRNLFKRSNYVFDISKESSITVGTDGGHVERTPPIVKERPYIDKKPSVGESDILSKTWELFGTVLPVKHSNTGDQSSDSTTRNSEENSFTVRMQERTDIVAKREEEILSSGCQIVKDMRNLSHEENAVQFNEGELEDSKANKEMRNFFPPLKGETGSATKEKFHIQVKEDNTQTESRLLVSSFKNVLSKSIDDNPGFNKEKLEFVNLIKQNEIPSTIKTVKRKTAATLKFKKNQKISPMKRHSIGVKTKKKKRTIEKEILDDDDDSKRLKTNNIDNLNNYNQCNKKSSSRSKITIVNDEEREDKCWNKKAQSAIKDQLNDDKIKSGPTTRSKKRIATEVLTPVRTRTRGKLEKEKKEEMITEKLEKKHIKKTRKIIEYKEPLNQSPSCDNQPESSGPGTRSKKKIKLSNNPESNLCNSNATKKNIRQEPVLVISTKSNARVSKHPAADNLPISTPTSVNDLTNGSNLYNSSISPIGKVLHLLEEVHVTSKRQNNEINAHCFKNTNVQTSKSGNLQKCENNKKYTILADLLIGKCNTGLNSNEDPAQIKSILASLGISSKDGKQLEDKLIRRQSDGNYQKSYDNSTGSQGDNSAGTSNTVVPSIRSTLSPSTASIISSLEIQHCSMDIQN